MSRYDFTIVQHEECTTPGSTLAWLEKHQLSYRLIRPDQGDTFPELTSQSRIVICGGIPNFNEDERFAWLVAEKKWIANILETKTPVVGLCLGAQLLAHVLGATVQKSQDWEYGWQPLQFSPEFSQWLGTPKIHQRRVFQCHGYQFQLPSGTVSVGSSKPTPWQGFFKERSILAFQFHPEADQEWIDLCVNVSKPKGPYCELVEDIPESTQKYLNDNIEWYHAMLDRFFLVPAL